MESIEKYQFKKLAEYKAGARELDFIFIGCPIDAYGWGVGAGFGGGEHELGCAHDLGHHEGRGHHDDGHDGSHDGGPDAPD